MSLEESVSSTTVETPEPVFIRPRRLRPANWNSLTLAERGLHDPNVPIPIRVRQPGDVDVDLPVAEAKFIV